MAPLEGPQQRALEKLVARFTDPKGDIGVLSEGLRAFSREPSVPEVVRKFAQQLVDRIVQQQIVYTNALSRAGGAKAVQIPREGEIILDGLSALLKDKNYGLITGFGEALKKTSFGDKEFWDKWNSICLKKLDPIFDKSVREFVFPKYDRAYMEQIAELLQTDGNKAVCVVEYLAYSAGERDSRTEMLLRVGGDKRYSPKEKEVAFGGVKALVNRASTFMERASAFAKDVGIMESEARLVSMRKVPVSELLEYAYHGICDGLTGYGYYDLNYGQDIARKAVEMGVQVAIDSNMPGVVQIARDRLLRDQTECKGREIAHGVPVPEFFGTLLGKLDNKCAELLGNVQDQNLAPPSGLFS